MPCTGLRPLPASTLALTAALLAACSSADTGESRSITTTTAAAAVESEAAQPRLALTYDGGLLIVDATTLDVVDDIDLDGFNRVNAAGDDRHVLVSHGDGFRVLDAGVWTSAHGDHGHHYAGPAVLTDVAFTSVDPGHVVAHDGTTALFFDGTGVVEMFETDSLGADSRNAVAKPATTTYTTPDPHHGVAVPLADGRLVVSVGTEEERTGVVVLDTQRREIARSEECPGVHGEAVAAGDAVSIGCENGTLVYRDGALRKIASPDPYGRIGNQAGSPVSPVVLGDYKSEPDAELERPTRVSLIDTTTGDLRLVDLGTSYTFRSLGRGPDGSALVLGYDGALHVLDPATGAVTNRIPVTGAWTEPDEWQQPRPALFVLGERAYVTEPASATLHVVDLSTFAVVASTDLPQTPNEITGVTG